MSVKCQVRAIRELRAAPMLQQDVSEEFEMKLPAYTNEERRYKGVAQHEFNCHPADFLEYDDPFALEEGEPVRFDVDVSTCSPLLSYLQ